MNVWRVAREQARVCARRGERTQAFTRTERHICKQCNVTFGTLGTVNNRSVQFKQPYEVAVFLFAPLFQLRTSISFPQSVRVRYSPIKRKQSSFKHIFIVEEYLRTQL